MFEGLFQTRASSVGSLCPSVRMAISGIEPGFYKSTGIFLSCIQFTDMHAVA